MNFPLSAHFLDDDADFADDASDFDLDFDEDYECLSDDEFNVSIDYDEYDSNDRNIIDDEFCLDDLGGFGDFDVPDDPLIEKDYVDLE